MSSLPPRTTPLAELFESWLPQVVKTRGLLAPLLELEASLGIVLEGKAGGEWTLELAAGELVVAARPRDATDLTLIQSVEDFRGALWGTRGGALGRRAAALLAPRSAARRSRSSDVAADWLDRLAAVDARVRIHVSDAAQGDWLLDLRLGPGPIPQEPHSVLRVAAEDTEAIARGELNALGAFLSGRLAISGDLSRLMRLL